MAFLSRLKGLLGPARTQHLTRPSTTRKHARFQHHRVQLAVEQLEQRNLLSGLNVAILGAPLSGQSPEGKTIALSSHLTGTTPGARYVYDWQVLKNDVAYANSSAARFAFTPNDAAAYQVTLTVTDRLGDRATANLPITADDVPPVVHLAGTFTGNALIALPFHATATSPSSVDQANGFAYTWNFGDGTTAFGAAPTHMYMQPGKYSVTVTVSDADGGLSTTRTTTANVRVPPVPHIAITDVPTGNRSPEALPITLGSTLANVVGGDTYAYTWNILKNGNQFAAGTNSTIAFTPNDNGYYVAILTVTDQFGAKVRVERAISVYDVAPTARVAPAFTGAALSPLTFSSATATDPSTVDTAHGFHFLWMFGDGTSTWGAAPTHTYARPGTYTVHVLAFDKDGRSGTTTTTVTVLPAITAQLTAPASVTAGTTTATVSFANVAGGSGGYSYSFDFGNTGIFEVADSSTASTTIPESYVDAGPAKLTIRGRVVDSNGDSRDFTTQMAVQGDNSGGIALMGGQAGGGAPGKKKPPLVATFSGPASVSEGTANAQVRFANVTGGSGTGYTYSYDFGNTGNFEIANSTSATATIPESYVDDAGTLAVHGRVTDSNGNHTDYLIKIAITDVAPTPTITALSVTDVGLPTAFKASGTSPSAADSKAGFSYAWNFGDGTATVAGANPTHAYSAPGTYTITLKAVDADDGTAVAATTGTAIGTTTTRITVGRPPTATFTGTPSVNEGSTSAQVTFTNPAGGSGGYTYSYDFGNTGTFEITGSASPTATIPESYVDDAGTLLVRGRITDSAGGSTDYTTAITIADVPPTPTITLPPGIDATVAASFQASQTSPSSADMAAGFTYTWNFGDGSAAVTGGSPTHTFTKAGTYTITLKAIDADGGTVAGSTSATIAVAPLPTATFSDPPVTEGTTNATVEFSNVLGGNPGYTYSYDFGNTGTFNISGSASPSATIPESYVDDAGTLTVRGRVTDSVGGYTDYTTTVTIVDAAPTPTITPPASVTAGVAATFQGSATSPSSADRNAGFAYTWSFGDGTATATGAAPTHTYATPGTYTVTLTAVDADGGTATGSTQTTVTVNPASSGAPTATFSGPSSVTEGTTTAQVGFTNQSGGTGGYTYSYDFGNTGTFEISGSSSATATIPESDVDDGPATLVVHGRITDSSGAYSDYTTSIQITDVAPTVSINAPPTALVGSAVGLSASVIEPSQADAAAGYSYSWNFGDGTTSTAATPSHTYATAGPYTVQLTITDTDGNTASASATITAENEPVNEPLLYQPDLQYVGAFRIPDYIDRSVTPQLEMNFGGTALAYDPAQNGLFMVGYSDNSGQPIGEFSIPNTLVNSSNLNDLATASVLQPLTTVISHLPTQLAGASDGTRIGGLMEYNGQLIGTDYAYYSGAYQQVLSHFVLSSTDLATASASGLYQVGFGGRDLAGYMTPIPSEWQAALGGYTALTGLGDAPIISSVSSGPAAFGFDPGQLGSANSSDTTFLYYPVNSPLGSYTGPADPMQNGTTSINGVVFVPGTSSILYFGSTGTSYSGYGDPGPWGGGVNGGKGPQSLNNQYSFQVWAYNAADFAAVGAGNLQPSQVLPYDVWNFTVPIPGGYRVGGVAYDSSTGRLYMSVLSADTQAAYSCLPVIDVFQVTIPSATSPPAAPVIGTLTGNPTVTPDPNYPSPDGAEMPQWDGTYPGPVNPGDPVLLTAGNVYASKPGDSITQVAFYLVTSNGNQLLGYGAPDTVDLHATQNYQLSISTSGLAAGTYTITAQATDADGLLSDPIAMTLTIA